MNPITDKLSRPLHDLRISVIDRCNFRCPYCMPTEKEGTHYSFLKQDEWLTFPEIVRLTRLLVELGVRKVRLTGGEPLLRPGIVDLVKNLSAIAGIEDLALTTNGSALSKFAAPLKAAGLQRLTVSLDSLDARVFKHMSGGKGSLHEVLAGIEEAQRIGFGSIKINVVVQKSVNDNSIVDLVSHFKNSPHVLRLIEYMDVGNCNHWESKYVVSSKEIIRLISQQHALEPLPSNYFGEVAERYRFKDGGGEIGFISSISQPFCQSCTRLRLANDGKLYTCLFATQGADIKKLVRQGANDQDLSSALKAVWAKRQDRYSQERSEIHSNLPKQKVSNPKIEMFQIGG
ncbi:MAG: GTP 3',8-cyclase MoaA [Candidatus Omnitrophota bacterium]|nr:GTP 3',8-cyclase MoaA [Candidatus Omnitrophota bacterium]